MKKPIWAIAAIAAAASAILLTSAASAGGPKPCGSVGFIDGSSVSITRGSDVIKDISAGDPVYNSDLIKTGPKTTLTLKMDKRTGFAGDISVAAKTSFYLNLEELKGQPSTSVQLMTGSVAMKVKKISGDPKASVRTESAACGVRGTEFDFTVAPTGDVMVSCEEGKVAIMGADGDTDSCSAGQAFTRTVGERFAAMPIGPKGADAARDAWYSEEIQVFSVNPAKALQSFIGPYRQKAASFIKTGQALAAEPAFITWDKEEKSKLKVNSMDAKVFKERKAIDPYKFQMKKDLFIFEAYYYRLLEIEEIMSGSGALDSVVDTASGLTARQFLAEFNRQKADLEKYMNLYRYLEKLEAKRAFADTESEGDDFFD